ncbi:4-hydroxy-tetrahydrodipicolinate synthase [Allobaculum fili]|uniref:4-hydroxy-tetrahydrodipicolinate synthase n=1 Tax=Allobaculum fili TaxID=2834460 RepID=UPI001E4D6504|nr:4-hydroxy-tetrahydrodipicolinate synthase [Allobaculum fili]
MLKKLPEGSIVALITPFSENGSVNFDKLRELIEWHIAHKTDGILILGTTGESSTMTHWEDDDVVRVAIEQADGRIPIIVGAGSNDSHTQLEKSLKYERMGADALLLISPYYNKANRQGLIDHFKLSADNVNIPIILYNIPGRTGVNIPVDVVEELSHHPMIQGIKEASGSLSYAMNIAKFVGEDFKMYSGNDDIIVPMLSLGASGVISVLADILPEETHDLVRAFLDGDVKKSLDLQLRYLDLIHKLFIEVNPIPVKEAMNLMGMGVGGYRLPLCPMDEKNREALAASMKEAGLL